jgi:hypothetical protein
MKKLLLVIIVLGIAAYLFRGQQLRSAKALIQEGDELFIAGDWRGAEAQYSSAKAKLASWLFADELKAQIYVRLALMEIARSGRSGEVKDLLEQALRTSDKILFKDVQGLAEAFNVPLDDSVLLMFRDIEFHTVLPSLLRQGSPLHKSRISLVSVADGELDIRVRYNTKDLETGDKSAATSYRSLSALKSDIKATMADIIATIYRFCSNRGCLAHIRYVDIEAKHGVRESLGFSSRSVEVDKVIYATRMAFADLPHNEEPSEQKIKASWTATVDLFPTLQIGP